MNPSKSLYLECLPSVMGTRGSGNFGGLRDLVFLVDLGTDTIGIKSQNYMTF